jgi:thiosulfate dehydrogenase [quinone] large subunit
MDIFDWLTLAEWLAVMRIGLGLWWLESVRHKNLRDFVAGGSMGWVDSLTKDHPVPAFANTVRSLSLSSPRRRQVTSWLVVLGEFAVGLSLVLGFLTPVGLAVGFFLNLNYFLLAGVPGDYGEQGQNLMMMLMGVVLFATGAWETWSLDHLLLGWG